jgi:predicted RNA-binding protein with PIN domain
LDEIHWGELYHHCKTDPNKGFLTTESLVIFHMPVVRILVDGYSLLHHWPELARGKARFSAAARDELIRKLTMYQDACGTPVTIIFDGAGKPGKTAKPGDQAAIEILFSTTGKTADQLIERVAHRMRPYGEILAVTDDYAERDTVIAMGGMASSCSNFIREVESALSGLENDVRQWNQKERRNFKKSSP